jgi:polyhydroxyalkanoate synthesis regulator phasin
MRYLTLLFILLLGCSPITKTAIVYQNEMQTKEMVEIGYAKWYREQANKCLDKAAAHGQSSIYEGKPVADRVVGIKKIYDNCIGPKDLAATEIAAIIDEINKENKEAGDLLIDVAKGIKDRSALLTLPVKLLPKVLRLKLLIESAEKAGN